MTDVIPGSAAGGAAVNSDGRTSAGRNSWRAIELVVATLILFAVAVGAGATAARADWNSDQHQQDQQSTSRSQTADEGQFLSLANDKRASVGSQALAPDAGLRDIARWWAARMAAANDIFHNYNLPHEVSDPWYQLGENVGMGWSVSDLHNAFVKSPSHYENLVEPSYQHVGIGVAYDANGKIFVVFDFMALQQPVAAPASEPPPQATAGEGMTLTRPRGTPPTAARPARTDTADPPPASVRAALVEQDPAPTASPPPPALPRSPSPAVTGVLTALRTVDRHTSVSARRTAPPSTSTTTPKPARNPSRAATVETKDAQTWTRPKPPAPRKSDHPVTPADAAKLWLTPTYCDPQHPKGHC